MLTSKMRCSRLDDVWLSQEDNALKVRFHIYLENINEYNENKMYEKIPSHLEDKAYL